MKEILAFILKNILEDSVKIKIEEEDVDGVVVFKTFVPKDKMGMVIGKGGRTINSIKNILKISAAKEEKRIEIELIES